VPEIKLRSQASSEDSSEKDGKKQPQKKTERVLGNWLKAYQEYTDESESPESFHLWTGLSIIASATRRNLWLDQGVYILYPNLFVILVGPPGKVAKSTSIRLGRTILYGVEGITFGPDSVTREELIHHMAKAGKDRRQSAVTLHSTELSSLIDPSGVKMIQFLTEIYDGDLKFDHATKHSGKDKVHHPVLNLLAGTTASWIATGFPTEVVGHGFTSRTIFIFEEEPRKENPFPGRPDKKLIRALVNDLDHLSRVTGPFQWGEGTKEVYAKLYHDIYTSLPSDYRTEGFHWRKRTHLLKVAMLLSIAENDELVIMPRDIETAWQLLMAIEPKMTSAFSAVGKYDLASDLERILAQIIDQGGMSPKEIYRRNYAVGDVDQLGKIIQMLQSMGKIKRVKDKEGQSIYVPT